MPAKSWTTHFNCPNCNALYQVVKAEAGPETVDREITCRACGGPLVGREGNFVLKYFLLRKAARKEPRSRRSSRRAASESNAGPTNTPLIPPKMHARLNVGSED